MKFIITLPFLIVLVSAIPTTGTHLQTPSALDGEGASNSPVPLEPNVENEQNENNSKPNITISKLSSINARV